MSTQDAPTTLAAAASYCPEDQTDICYQWGVPEASASSGSGNIYFQLRAPESVQWVGLGIGSQMSGAQMFLMYQDGKGNVTLSTRKGTGHVMPQFEERSDVELLAGSGVVDGKMIANVRCSKCTGLDLGGSTGWIGAWKKGDPLDSTSTSAIIVQHDIHSIFTVDLGKASISSDSNPFDSSGSGSSGNSGSGSSSGSSGSTGNSGAVTQASNPNQTLIYAHGILMTVVMLAGFPLGSMLMPLIGNWVIHASWQMLAFLGMWAGLGIGYICARRLDIVSEQINWCYRRSTNHGYSVLRPSSHEARHLCGELYGHTAGSRFLAPPPLHHTPEERHHQPYPHLVGP